MNDIQKRLQRLEGGEKARRDALKVLDELNIKEHIAPVYFDLHEDLKSGEHKIFNLPGGRGSAKSSFVSLEIVDGIMSDTTGRTNAIVFRLYGSTLRDSVYSQISWAIDMLGVGHLWKSQVSPMQMTYIPTGAQILFRGLDDATKLKSIKPPKGIFRYVWFEEFCELPGPSFLRSVTQSVVRGQGPNVVVFRSFNPPVSSNNWANLLIQEPDKRAVTLLTNYTMIPPEWLGEDFIVEAERLKMINPKAYEHEYMGVPTGSGGEVFPGIDVRGISNEEINNLQYLYNGLDFGFAVDPACFVRLGYDRKHETIYFVDEIYKRQCSNAEMASLIKNRKYNDEYTICDCAEPKSIADLRASGINAKACYKRPGCVEYRVRWLQHRRIVIDPERTPNAYREFVNYSYPTGKDGEFLSKLEDKDNHSIDATAYALDRIIFRYESIA